MTEHAYDFILSNIKIGSEYPPEKVLNLPKPTYHKGLYTLW